MESHNIYLKILPMLNIKYHDYIFYALYLFADVPEL